jgi:hypothetical protein
MTASSSDVEAAKLVVLTFQTMLRAALALLASEVFFIGRKGDFGPMVGWTVAGDIVRSGMLPDGSEYKFHGVGCLVVTRDESEVDFDWSPEGEVLFDVWRLRRFHESRGGEPQIGDDALRSACAALVDSGELLRHDEQFFRFKD